MSFPAGTMVTCINDACRKGDLTIGKTYEVLESSPTYVSVISDSGRELSVIPERFVLENEFVAKLYSEPNSKLIENEHVYAFDVDNTLVFTDDDFEDSKPDRIKVIDPYDLSVMFVRVHKHHRKLLMQMKARGRFIIVWSQRGGRWGRAVCQALDLDKYVDQYMTKLEGHVDDLPCTEWMTNRIYISGDNK